MGLEISSTLLARLLSEARASRDAEVCGLLFGSSTRIEAAEACANVAVDTARTFEIDPAALFAAHRAVRVGGRQVIGCYHSHPTGQAVPSARDAEGAMGDGAVWLIIGGGTVRAWRTRTAGAFEAVTLDQARSPGLFERR